MLDGVFPFAEPLLRSGSLDCYIGPAPRQSAASDFIVEKLFDNTRVILCRKGHPLRHAKSLGELGGAEWVATSIMYRAEDELDPLFRRHGFPPPKIAMTTHSALTFISTVAASDLLTMLPVQWAEFPVTQSTFDTIDVKEVLPAYPICIVRRADLPLTPAAEYFCDMIRRASSHLVLTRSKAAANGT